MPTGSCLCGAAKISVSGPPTSVVTCHCRDCRKISGGVYSVNWVVPSERVDVQTTGPAAALSSVAVTADSGNCMTGYFCPGCGTTLYRASDGVPGLLFVKAGVLDGGEEVLEAHPPQGESWTLRRPGWVPPIEGAKQAEKLCQL